MSTESTARPPELKLKLETEWQRQVRRFIVLDFHEALGSTEADYRASLPRFTSQPEAFRGRFDLPLLVETRIPVAEQARRAGLAYNLEDLNVRDWEEDPQGYKTPETPYKTWAQDGKKNLRRPVREVRKTLEPDERGGTELDGVAFYIAYPEVFEDHFIDMPGSSVESVLAPFLRVWFNEPKLRSHRIDASGSKFGSLTCGRELMKAG